MENLFWYTLNALDVNFLHILPPTPLSVAYNLHMSLILLFSFSLALVFILNRRVLVSTILVSSELLENFGLFFKQFSGFFGILRELLSSFW